MADQPRTVATLSSQTVLLCAAVALVPLTLVASAVGRDSATWWPSFGLATTAMLLATGRGRAVMAAVLVVVLTPLAMLVYDVDLAVGVFSTVPTLVPAVLGARWLRADDDGGRRPRVRGFASARYHVVLAGASGLCGLLTGAAVLFVQPVGIAALWTLSSTIAALTSLLVVLPLVTLTEVSYRGTGSALELGLQRVAVVAVVAAMLLPAAWVSIVLVFPLLAWGGLRASRREAHLQACLVSLVVYVIATTGNGPLAPSLWDSLPVELTTVPLHLFLASACYLLVPLALVVERLSVVGERATQAVETMERMLDDANATMFVLFDASGRTTRYNVGAENILGYHQEEVLGLSPEMFHPAGEVERQAAELGTPPDFAAVVREQVARGLPRDWVCQCRDGSLRTVSLSFGSVTDGRGRVVGHLATGTDVTERERAQEALGAALDHEQAAVRRFQELDQTKSELVSNVSHELRTPITSIRGYSEVLADGSYGDLSSGQRAAVTRISRNADRLSRLVEDLLTLSVADAGRLHLARDLIDLRAVAHEAHDAALDAYGSRGLSFVLELPDHDVPVRGDRRALERVVLNLLSNAVKFTPDGGSVDTRVSLSDTAATVVVRDTGVGVSSDDADRVFRRFFRSSQAAEREIQGTGLGLHIVEVIVSGHGGTVDFRSTLGAGTTVTVAFPHAGAVQAVSGG